MSDLTSKLLMAGSPKRRAAGPLPLRGGDGGHQASSSGGEGPAATLAGWALRALRHPAVNAAIFMAIGGFIVYLAMTLQAPPVQQPAPRPEVPQPMGEVTEADLRQADLQRQQAADKAAKLMGEKRAATICKDTCFKARDGVCDDGRNYRAMMHGREDRVLCDLGTDCSDCGPWRGAAHSPAWREAVGPVEYLRARGIEVRVRQTAFLPRFFFAYTNPAHDVDVSASMNATGGVEQAISHIFYHVLHKPCAVDGSGLLVDVGGNFGWYSVFSAVLGCNVVAFEPVPHFRAFFEYNLARNGLTHKVEIRPTVAVARHGTYTVVVPQRGIWGTAGIDGANIDEFIDNEKEYERVNVTGEVLDKVLADVGHIDLLKIDVEGFEPDVVDGARALLDSGRVDNVIMEYSPHVDEKKSKWDDLTRAPRMLLSLIESPANFTIGHLVHRGGEEEITGWSQALGLYGQVTAETLHRDILDARLISKLGMMWAREPCPAMVNLNLVVDGIPERFHPKSFRSVIGINTNVWASRSPRFVPHLRGPAVGIFPPEQLLTDSWFIPEGSDLGAGARSCEGLRETARAEKLDAAGRTSLLVSHHCRCGPEYLCPHAEAVAEECAKKGLVPWDE